jgi:ABC-2 type transport system ATP-binding protein
MSYGDLEAVRGVDLEVHAGEVFAFLGPNGAGKTTTVEILEGYRKRSRGEVSVLGEDPERAGREWRQRIGIVLQSCRLDPYLSVRESLQLYAGYYANPRPVDEVIELVGLGEKADARTGKLSGGQQRRLDVGMALVGDPELLFLDEPTTGFDPQARRQAWEAIAGLRRLGKTVFLTTHYMDEAQQLADRVAIIAGGQIVARGTPEDLGDRDSQPTKISYRGPDGAQVALSTTTPVQTLNELTGRALAEGFELENLEVRRPTLEDVYLELTEQGAPPS